MNYRTDDTAPKTANYWRGYLEQARILRNRPAEDYALSQLAAMGASERADEGRDTGEDVVEAARARMLARHRACKP